GPEKVRIAWKYNPSTAQHAREAATLGEAIFEVGGSPAFFAFTKALFDERRTSSGSDLGDVLVHAAEAASAEVAMKARDIKEKMESDGPRIDEDTALAKT